VDEDVVSADAATESPVLYEQRGPIAVITLNRPHLRNAQNTKMTIALDDAFHRFAQEESARVAILCGAGKHFSSGHDLSAESDWGEWFPRQGMWWNHVGNQVSEFYMAYEEEYYLGMCRRWRELPKPTIAMVHGACIAGALILAWACDLIVASDDAFFADPVVKAGVPGIEFFAHPWEMGSRFAKEFLFLGERVDAPRAYELGMVNRVVPRDDLEAATLDLAERIAEMPRFGLALAKQAVHQAEEAMGLRTGTDAAFALHQLAHAHNFATTGNAMLVGTGDLKTRMNRDERTRLHP
jgi:enoyl-CoA hydratase